MHEQHIGRREAAAHEEVAGLPRALRLELRPHACNHMQMQMWMQMWMQMQM